MNDKLSLLLQSSALLAERWQMVTPHMALAWNPRDENSVFGAVQKWLSYINEHLFPIYEVWEIDEESVLEVLTTIPVLVMGFESHNYEYEEFKKSTFTQLLFFQFLVVFGDTHAKPKLRVQVYGELKERGFSALVPMHKLYEWLDATLTEANPHPLFPEGNGRWQGCVYAMKYFCNDTGMDLLDMTMEDLYSGYELPEWCIEEVEGFIASWAEAKVINDQIDAFINWSNESAENGARVIEVLQAGCMAIAASGWKADRYDLSKIEAAWQASQNGVNDGTNKEG